MLIVGEMLSNLVQSVAIYQNAIEIKIRFL